MNRYFSFLFILAGLLWLPSISSAAYVWNSEAISEPNYFRSTTQSILTDSTNNQHIFYGGLHLYHSFFDGTTWQKEIVDSSPRVGMGAVATIDANNKFHIVYQDEFNNIVKYATNVSGQWVSQALILNQPSLNAYFQPAIAVDGNNAVHITYLAFSGMATLAYATNKSGAWVSSILNSPQLNSLNPNMAIAVDSSGNIHALCNTSLTSGGGFNHDLVYANNTSGSWVFQTLETSTRFNSYNHSSLKVDSTNKVHIAYLGNDSNLRHLTNTTGAWISSIVDNGVGYEGFPSLAIDNYSNLHISYMVDQAVSLGTLQTEVRYAENTTGNWITYYNGVTNGSSGATSLSLNANNAAHIAYFDVNTHTLNYLNNKAAWGSSVIDTSSDTNTFYNGTELHDAIGLYPDSIVDTNGKTHITYHQGPTHYSGPLIYSTNASGAWTKTVVHSSGQQSKVAVDSLGYAHVVFYADTGLDLFYATNRSGAWVTQFIESTLGENDSVKPSIHIDNNGFAHIVYYKGSWFSSVDVRYATNTSGAWQTETIDVLGKLIQWGGSDAPMFVSAINLDNASNPRVTYLNNSRDVAFATRTTGGWSTSIIAPRPTIGLTWMDLSLTLDDQGKIHAAFRRLDCTSVCFDAGIGYANNTSMGWAEEIVNDNVYYTNSENTGMVSPTIALDSNNQPHISYIHYLYQYQGSQITKRTVFHSQKTGSIWRTSLIKILQIKNSPSSYKGQSTTVSISPSGIPTLAYYNSENGSLDLAIPTVTNSPLINIFNTPNSSDFGSIDIGKSATISITVQNIGTLPLNVSNISLTNLEGAGFTVDLLNGVSSPCTLTSFTLASNASCSFSINYKSSQLGSASATVTVSSNDPDLASLANTFFASTVEQATPPIDGGSGGGCISNPINMTYFSWLVFGFLTFGLWGYRKLY